MICLATSKPHFLCGLRWGRGVECPFIIIWELLHVTAGLFRNSGKKTKIKSHTEQFNILKRKILLEIELYPPPTHTHTCVRKHTKRKYIDK